MNVRPQKAIGAAGQDGSAAVNDNSHGPQVTEIEDVAVDYVTRGWSVIPLGPKSKKPAISSWTKFQGERAGEARIRDWFRSKPTSNIGVITGEISGMIVLDVDGPEGEASLAKFGDLPITPTVRTGKGRHYYFMHPGFKVANFAGKREGLDLRADGGYVVAPPSIHESGRKYEWEVSPDAAPLANMPEWLLELIQRSIEPQAVPAHGDNLERVPSLRSVSSFRRGEKLVPAVVENILDHLDGVTESGNGWSALCPAHGDQHNSLSVAEGDDGRVLIKCFAGCDAGDVLDALDLDMGDLFPHESNASTPSNPCATLQRSDSRQISTAGGCSLAGYADAKRLPLEFLEQLGIREQIRASVPAIRIPYRSENGEELAVRYRTSLSKGEFRWKTGTKPCLYGLWRLKDAIAANNVVLVEGESDCHTLWLHGIPALGLPGAALWKEERDANFLAGIETIYVLIEPDRGGETLMASISKSAIRDRVRVLELGEFKDPSELYLADPESFTENWEKALSASESWSDIEKREAEQRKQEAWQECQELAESPRLLEDFSALLEESGVVGEVRTAKLLYLALCSRFFNRPISVAVKGPSSGGKSFVTESVLKFFPEDTYHALTAMSEKALAYGDEPLSHRFLVIYEAAGMSGDMQSYLIRSLLSEGRIHYETVEKTSDGLKPRVIEREGPTGLLVTTTAINLHPENETRLLSVTVKDGPDQTRSILEALADEEKTEIDYAPWQALQRWLGFAEHKVTIPFGVKLSQKIPNVAVRLRRDFMAVLNLIKAHALLHQANRELDDRGFIIATLDDYRVVRDLVLDLLAEAVGATVSATVRETVDAVEALVEHKGSLGDKTVSLPELAKFLELDKASVSRRVKNSRYHGYLVNKEDKKGRPAQLAIGEPMPDDVEVLPPQEDLK